MKTKWDWWPSIEKPREQKKRMRDLIAGDVQAFLDSGGSIEQGVSRQVRLVSRPDIAGTTRRVYADSAAREDAASLQQAFSKKAPPEYGRRYRADLARARAIKAGLRGGDA